MFLAFSLRCVVFVLVCGCGAVWLLGFLGVLVGYGDCVFEWLFAVLSGLLWFVGVINSVVVLRCFRWFFGCVVVIVLR